MVVSASSQGYPLTLFSQGAEEQYVKSQIATVRNSNGRQSLSVLSTSQCRTDSHV